MSGQGTLFGEQLRDEAVERVGRNANEEFKAQAYRIVRVLADIGERFTTDDVWALMTAKTHEPRALGAIMTTARKRGIIAPLDEWRLSTRPECHRRPLRVWVGS